MRTAWSPPLGQVLLGRADQESARAAAGALRVDVHVDVALAGIRAVVHEPDLGRADHLAVLLGDERPVVGVGVHVGDVVGDGVRGHHEEGEGEVADAGEALDVGSYLGTQGAHDYSHHGARYGDRREGRLSFSGGYGTIGL